MHYGQPIWQNRKQNYSREDRAGSGKAEKHARRGLSKQLEKVNREELRKKIDELDAEKIKEMKLDVEEIKKKLTPADMEKIKKLAGKDADLIMKKINELSKKWRDRSWTMN